MMMVMMMMMMMAMFCTICPVSTVKLFMLPAILGPPVHVFPKHDSHLVVIFTRLTYILLAPYWCSIPYPTQ